LNPILSGKKEFDRFTKRYIHKNGSIVWADVSTRLQRDREGNPLYFITAIIDITEKKKVDEALMETNEIFKRTESIAHVGSWEWDIQSDRVYWSEELFRIFGRDPSRGAPSYADHPKIFTSESMQRLDAAVRELHRSGNTI
jgi:PAS domain-containing protein